jgi:hypothetical protein
MLVLQSSWVYGITQFNIMRGEEKYGIMNEGKPYKMSKMR